MGTGDRHSIGAEENVKIALFSPLNPVKTGISDYTEELLPDLARQLDVEIFIDPGCQPSAELDKRFSVRTFDADTFQAQDYDAILYHMGNNYAAHRYIYESLQRFPGIVVLHDYVMQGFYAEQYDATGDFFHYQTLLKKFYGERGKDIAESIRSRCSVPIWESPGALHYPLNEEIVGLAKGLIVHSDFVRDRILALTSSPVVTIPLHGHVSKIFDTLEVREELGLEEDDILICSAGYVNKNKRFDKILEALLELPELNFRFVITGEDRGKLLKAVLPSGRTEFQVLGYLPLPAMERIISASDICINLRYPTMGESSGSLLRMMGYGKPILVTNIGSYAEFPDYAVLKIEPDIDEKEKIKRYIRALAQDLDFRKSVGREAREYVEEECSIPKCAAAYADFIRQCSREPGDRSG